MSSYPKKSHFIVCGMIQRLCVFMQMMAQKEGGNVHTVVITLQIGVQQKCLLMWLYRSTSNNIAFCTHCFTEKQRKRFKELMKGKNKKCDACAVASEMHNINIIQHNISTASTLDMCKKVEQCIICDQYVEHCKGCYIK